ncbi:hypothetical protein Ancab_021407 [Ancistrocladus abbreviatus]
MELFYLLCSIICTCLISLILSFLLLLRKFLPHLQRSPAAASNSFTTLYEGTVWHERRRPVHHSFRYQVRYALIELDHAPNAPPSHISADEARKIAETTGPVFLLTIPPSVGYEQNPLSLYYCYDLEGSNRSLKKCIAEVTNTPWGERVSFVFNPDSDLVAKALHVSPFMDMLGSWSIKATAPGDDLSVVILVQHPDLGQFFSATLKALKLWWKNVQFIQHPRYANPAYREDALLRDQGLKCCAADRIESSTGAYLKHNRNQVVEESHQFLWQDAKWPWS